MITDDAVRILFHFKEVFYNSERPQFQNNKTIAIDDALNIFCHLKEMFYDRKGASWKSNSTLGRIFVTVKLAAVLKVNVDEHNDLQRFSSVS